MVQSLTMEEYEYCLRVKRAGFRALRVGKRVGEPLRGAWHAPRGVTCRTIDPAWWSAGGSGAAPARRR